MADEGRNMWMSFPTLFKFSDHKTPAAFVPSCHIFYTQRCVDVKDGKTKWSKHQGESDQIPEKWGTPTPVLGMHMDKPQCVGLDPAADLMDAPVCGDRVSKLMP